MKTYLDVIEIVEKAVASNKDMYVPVFYATGTYEWFKIDKEHYLRVLRGIGNPEIKFPCYVEVDEEGDVYIHAKSENSF